MYIGIKLSEDTTVRVSRNLAKFLECIKVTLDSDSLEDTIWQLIKLALPLDPEIEAIIVKLAIKRGIKVKIAVPYETSLTLVP